VKQDLVRGVLDALQGQLCATIEAEESAGRFERDAWRREPGQSSLCGDGVTAVLEGGDLFERAGVALSDVAGERLPPAATARNPHLAGRGFRALGVSVVVHPRHPAIPTSHLNVRCFSAGDAWWFGGGFDLTPYLPYEDDVILWHEAAATACRPFDPTLYAHARAHCDEYFYIRHRGEARGVGGIFYDDLNDHSSPVALPWQACFELMQSVVAHFSDAYLAIVRRRRSLPWSERERRYQLYRRGRYVEFNLVLDRGTLFGLQSGGRSDSILLSMPPEARWSYHSPDPELDARLLPYLTTWRGRDWLDR
jgi:coproporphyrinogen III oxidase